MWKPIIAFTIVILTATPCMSAALNVPSQYSTIAEALSVFVWGDTIYLEPGIYSGPGFENLSGSGKLIVSTAGPEQTTIDLKGKRFWTGNVDVHGISFVSGSIVMEGPWLDAVNCIFDGNQVAIKQVSTGCIAGARIDDCEFLNNDTAMSINRTDLGLTQVANSEFLYNTVAISVDGECGGAWPCYFSLFGYNGTVVSSNSDSIWSIGNVFYNNNNMGEITETLGGPQCTIIWNDTVPGNLSESSLKNANGLILNVDPLFCDPTLLTTTDVNEISPCLPENNICGSLVGNVSIGCSCCNDDTRGNVDYIVGPGGPIDVSDLTYQVSYLFQGGIAPPCLDAANVDGLIGAGGPVDVSDLTYLVAYLFQGGPQPPACP